MPKNRKDSSDSDSDSGPDDRNTSPPPKKKSKPVDSGKSGGGSGAQRKKGSDGSTYFELEGPKRVSIREFKGKLYVDIREFYEKDGAMLPGKKGISLTLSAWNRLKSLNDDVDQVLRELR